MILPLVMEQFLLMLVGGFRIRLLSASAWVREIPNRQSSILNG